MIANQKNAMFALVGHRDDSFFNRNTTVFNAHSEFPPYGNVIDDASLGNQAHGFQSIPIGIMCAIIQKYTQPKDFVGQFHATSEVGSAALKMNRGFVGVARSSLLQELAKSFRSQLEALASSDQLITNFLSPLTAQEARQDSELYSKFAYGSEPANFSERFLRAASGPNPPGFAPDHFDENDNIAVESAKFGIQLKHSTVAGAGFGYVILLMMVCVHLFFFVHPECSPCAPFRKMPSSDRTGGLGLRDKLGSEEKQNSVPIVWFLSPCLVASLSSMATDGA
jgi:hypothetical protein